MNHACCIVEADINQFLKSKAFLDSQIDLTFLDPPFNQAKVYASHSDNLPKQQYWDWMKAVCAATYANTSTGGTIYFMQREKNSEYVLRCLRETGWTLQNFIIWKKLTSAVPSKQRYGKHYQIIAYASKGRKARVFHQLRINPPLPAHYKHKREKGLFVTDIWDDIRELTSGYFAGDEALRNSTGERFHKQQAPIALLLRILLSSSQTGDTVFDPFAGTGTTLVVAHQLNRHALGVEIDPDNAECIRNRLDDIRASDDIQRFYDDYEYTDNLERIWSGTTEDRNKDVLDLPLFRSHLP